MARYVLIEFDDNNDAETFVKAVEEVQGILVTTQHPKIPDQYGVVKPSHDYRIRGLYAKPTRFCECSDVLFNERRKGAKLGWYVHPTCGRPVRGSWQWPRNLLLPQETLPADTPLYVATIEPTMTPEEVHEQRLQRIALRGK